MDYVSRKVKFQISALNPKIIIRNIIDPKVIPLNPKSTVFVAKVEGVSLAKPLAF